MTQVTPVTPAQLAAASQADGVQVWGHRGSRVPGPENSPQAVLAALAAGADGSEVDVRRSADGALVCVHDALIAEGGRPVIELTTTELAAAGIRPLPDVVSAARGGRLVIEVKNVPGEPDYTPEALTARWLVTALGELLGTSRPGDVDVLVSSFDPTALDIARDAGWPTGLLTLPGVAVADGLAFAAAAGYTELHAHIGVVTEAAVRVHDAGLRLAVWTITTVGQALALSELGVDAAICDDPAAIASALRAAGRT